MWDTTDDVDKLTWPTRWTSKRSPLVRVELCKFLTFIRILLNSWVYFWELTLWDIFVEIVIHSFESSDPLISFIAASVLKAMLSYPHRSADKIEWKNWEYILANHDLLNALLRKLQYCEFNYDSSEEQETLGHLSLELTGVLNIFIAFYQIEIFLPANLKTTDIISRSFYDPSMKTKDLFHICEKFSMTNCWAIAYGFTFLINSSLEFYIYSGKEINPKEYILNYSVLFIWNIYQHCNSFLPEQKEVSLCFLSNMLSDNKTAVFLMLSIFEKSLFWKV
jgi:hypothetical protein